MLCAIQMTNFMCHVKLNLPSIELVTTRAPAERTDLVDDALRVRGLRDVREIHDDVGTLARERERDAATDARAAAADQGAAPGELHRAAPWRSRSR